MSTINALCPGCKCVNGFTASKFTCNLSAKNTFVKSNYKIIDVSYNIYIVPERQINYCDLDDAHQNWDNRTG